PAFEQINHVARARSSSHHRVDSLLQLRPRLCAKRAAAERVDGESNIDHEIALQSAHAVFIAALKRYQFHLRTTLLCHCRLAIADCRLKKQCGELLRCQSAIDNRKSAISARTVPLSAITFERKASSLLQLVSIFHRRIRRAHDSLKA